MRSLKSLSIRPASAARLNDGVRSRAGRDDDSRPLLVGPLLVERPHKRVVVEETQMESKRKWRKVGCAWHDEHSGRVRVQLDECVQGVLHLFLNERREQRLAAAVARQADTTCFERWPTHVAVVLDHGGDVEEPPLAVGGEGHD